MPKYACSRRIYCLTSYKKDSIFELLFLIYLVYLAFNPARYFSKAALNHGALGCATLSAHLIW